MRQLIFNKKYDRQEVHDIFDPTSNFKISTGTWGLQGIVRIPSRDDYVFFVTFGQTQGEHTFEENIDENGILTWQSQPRQTLQTAMIKKFINHNHLVNNIYLFLRTDKKSKYTYLGKLAYVTHDPTREQPVYFKWQLLDWDSISDNIINIGIRPSKITNHNVQTNTLSPSSPPERNNSSTETQRNFRGRNFNYSENDSKNKKIGLLGELLVVKSEKEYLNSNGRNDLAEQVEHTSQVQGDGTGYDIKSYTLDGKFKYIEVKTTVGGINTPFIMSINELAFSQVNSDKYYLYRVYNYNKRLNNGDFYVLQGCIDDNFLLEPIQYKVKR